MDGLEGVGAVGGAVQEFAYGTSTVSDLSDLCRPVLHTITTVSKATEKVGLTAAKLAGYALQAGKLINSDIITRSKRNVSESTGQMQSKSMKIPNEIPQLNPGIKTQEMKEREKRYEGLSGFEQWKADFNGQQDAVDERVHQQMVNEVENSAGGSFPFIGSWLKAGKYKLMGSSYNSEAGKSLKHAVIETAAAYGIGKAIEYTLLASAYANTGTNLWPAASGGRTVINEIEYTVHALERMQPVGTIMKGTTLFSRGIPPSVVENAVKYGIVTPGNSTAEVVRTFENVRVITNPEGSRVISVFKIGD